MKNLMIVLILSVSLGITAQSDELAVNTGINGGLTKFTNQNAMDFGSSVSFKNPARNVEGTLYLFDNWDSRGVIVSNDGRRFAISKINLNVKRQSFESLYDGDKIFTFNFNNVDKFIINNKVYKNYYYNDDVNVYEVISKTKDFELLKGFRLKFVEGSANPMLSRSSDRYIRKENYYVKEGDIIRPFRLKKKQLLKLVGEEKAQMLLDFADKNKLSFKKEEDVKSLLESVK